MKAMHKYMMVALLGALTLSASAQQVTTLYFLENAPMRHTINPAFQPVSNGYLNFTPLGWMSAGAGNNALTMSDLIFVDPATGKTMTILHPDAVAQRAAFQQRIPAMTLLGGDITLGLLNFGFRVQDFGYVTVGVNERLELGNTIPQNMIRFLSNGTVDLTNTALNLNGLGLGGQAYTEIALGYSHRINEQWTVGGKLKILLGQGYARVNGKQMGLTTNEDLMHIQGDLAVDFSGPLNLNYLVDEIKDKGLEKVVNNIKDGSFPKDSILNTTDRSAMIRNLLKPSGAGAALDLGFTYKPIEQLQISLALNDLGFIYWTRSSRFTGNLDTYFDGVGEINFGDPEYQDENGNFSAEKISQKAIDKFYAILENVSLDRTTKTGMAKMVSTRLNIGVDANFWDNRVGVGVVSATRLYNARLYEEVTLGASFRPVNWFNIAASYSLLNNGKYSCIGAGLGFMPYDGINLTLTMDYIPTSYAKVPKKNLYVIPDKAEMVNVALGFSIVWGSNKRDSDKDGVWDKIDMCPNTPRGVVVDEQGCPLDEDHDGVPDYLDHCLGTPEEALGYIDSLGCPKDSDGDGVPDYLDQCPNTPDAAWGLVDSIGCPIDSDGDGVPDYMDQCPGTPEEARGRVDANGCPLDSDGDGVPDYLDQCPGTPAEALGTIDENGCPKDSDGDGVPDYKDECPNTPAEVQGKVDAKGCILDSDGDGVPDYQDECPFIAGVKENKGCPEVKREVRQLLQKAMQGIEFETGKATIKAKSYPLLNQIAQIFVENKNYIIEVQGHTDNTGKYEINKELSEKRANAVRDYLIEQGVDFQRLTAVGYGPDVPIADNKTKAGRAKNRRVEFNISFEEVSYETVLDHAEPAPAAETPAAEAPAAEAPAAETPAPAAE